MTDAPNPQPRRHRRLRRWLLVAALTMVAACAGEYVISRALSYKLRDLVSDRLDAELKIDSLWYIPPFGAHISGASLWRDQERLLKVGPSDFELTQLPLPGRPLLIRSITVQEPIVELVRDSDGFIGGPGFVKKRATTRRHRAPRKLSDILRLSHFKLQGGQITYIDQRRPEPLPVSWGDINVDVELAQKSPSNYGFQLTAQTAQAAEVSLLGVIDVDSLVLDVQNMGLKVDADPLNDRSPLPAALQRALKKFAVRGTVTVSGNARLPLKQIDQSTYAGAIALQDVSGYLPEPGLTLDRASCRIEIEQGRAAPAAAPVAIRITSFDAVAAGMRLVLDRGQIDLDGPANRWTLGKLSGHLSSTQPAAGSMSPSRHRFFLTYAPRGHLDFTLAAAGPLDADLAVLRRDVDYHVMAYSNQVSLQLPRFGRRLEGIGGAVRIENGIISLSNFTAVYGNDRFRIAAARMPLAPLPNQVRVEEIAAAADFGSPPSIYSPRVMKFLEPLTPQGTFVTAGWVSINRTLRPRKIDYGLQLSSDTAAVNLGPWKVPVTGIRSDIFLTPTSIEVSRVEANLFDGRLIASGRARIDPQGDNYEGRYDLRNARLERVEDLREANGGEAMKLTGAIFSDGVFGGSWQKNQPALDGLRGQGTLEIIRGDFFRLPIFGELLKRASYGQSIGTLGELATVYTIGNRSITLTKTAVNSPLVGIQGSGTVGLDGKLDLMAVVAPLADWRAKIQKTRIPIVSRATGEIVGAVQQLLNRATGALVYQFRVDGEVGNPRVRPVPVPVLTDTAAFLFGRMVQGVRERDLLVMLKGPAASAPAPPPAAPVPPAITTNPALSAPPQKEPTTGPHSRPP